MSSSSSPQPLSALCQAGRKPPLPLMLALPDGRLLRLETLLRVLPGHRYVGMAIFDGRAVLAKLFVGGKAKRRFRAEKEGVLQLIERELPTPRLWEAGYAEKENVGWLLLEYLPEARNLEEILTQSLKGTGEGAIDMAQLMAEAASAIAGLHTKGLFQEDLHPGNLLWQDGTWYWIDGGGIRAAPRGEPVSEACALSNFGLFFSQLPLSVEIAEEGAWLSNAIAAYQQINPALSEGWSSLTVHRAAARERRRRIRNWLRKIGRECSNFICRPNGWRSAFGLTVVRREDAEALTQLLAEPDAFIAKGETHKAGGTATVAQVDLAGRRLIIKRYNIKHWRHWLSRCWRASRAWHSWREGNRLLALGMETAKPLAVMEERFFWLRRRAWLVCEYLEGEDALACLQSPAQTREINALKALFAELAEAKLGHGDMKGHNLIWRADIGRWALIDLDAMHAYRSDAAFARAHRRDRDRFLRNWPKREETSQGADGNTETLRQHLAALLAGR